MPHIAGYVTNSVDPDQTPSSVTSDLVLHCVLKPICADSKGYYIVLTDKETLT